MYTDITNKGEAIKLCDNIDFVKKALSKIEAIQSILNNKDTLNLLLLRQKPRVASQRIVSRLLQYPRLSEKYRETITGLEKREKEIRKEIEQSRK